ncbi:MAG: hypothetical protein OHK0013_40780 [Sandaracinaceae bacterium]
MAAALAAALAPGCLPAETVVAPPISPVRVEVAITLDGATVRPNDVVPLPDGSLLVDGEIAGVTGDEGRVLVLAYSDGRSPQVIGTGGEIGAVRSVSSSGDVTLVVGESGVLAIQAGALFRVPVEAMLGVREVRTLVALERAGESGVLDWLVATDAGLFVVIDDEVRPLLADGSPLDVVDLAPRGPGSAWAADADGLVRITLDRDGAPRLERLARAGQVTAVASDAEGRPWWVEDGVLWSLTRDLRAIVRSVPTVGGARITDLTAIPGDRQIWIHTGNPIEPGADGLLHYDGDVFRRVDAELDGLVVRCATGSECIVLDPSARAASRLRVRHAAVLEGLAEGGSLHDRTELRVIAEAEDRLASVRAEIDGQPVEVTDGALTLVPADIGFGPRTLVVTVTWDDGTLPLVLRRTFVSEAPATWVEDVEPVYATHCSDCHGAAGPSARRLDSREGWMREYDRILPAIRSGAMPLGRPRLSDETITLIETWAEAGFPE